MKKSIIDTDILSYYMKKNEITVENVEKYLNEHDYLNISRISVIEILGGLKAKNAISQIGNFEALIVEHNILDTTELSAEISSDIFAELWKKGKHSGNFDILIAGIAIANNLTLVTNNTKDYENISGLDIENWTLRIE